MPLATASTLSAHARVLLPISSVAKTMTNTLRAMPSGLPMVCVATKTENDGDSAPSDVTNGANQANATIILRRPNLSAVSANGNAMTTPQRTIAAPKPCPLVLMPNSVAAYATVWVKTVLTKAEGRVASHSNQSTLFCWEVRGSEAEKALIIPNFCEVAARMVTARAY